MLPDEMAGFVVHGGSIDTGARTLELADPDLVADLREWLGGESDPYYVRFEGRGLPLDAVQRLSRLGELWVDAGPEDMGDVLDLAFSGAGRVVCDVGVVPDDDLEDTFAATDGGIVLAVAPAAKDRLGDAASWAEEHGVPLLARDGVALRGIPDTVHVYQATGGPGPAAVLRKVAGPVEGGDDEE